MKAASLIICLMWLVQVSTVQAQPKLPAATPEMFGALPTVADVAISPNGKLIAALQHGDEAAAVAFYQRENLQATPLGFAIGKSKPRSIRWIDDETLLVLVSVTERVTLSSGLKTIEFWRWIAIDPTTKKSKILFGNEGNYYLPDAGSLLASRIGEPKSAVFSRLGFLETGVIGSSSRVANAEKVFLNLIEANLKSGKYRRVATGNANTEQWIVDAAGEPLARVDFDAERQMRRIFRASSGGFTEIAAFNQAEIGGGHRIFGATPSGDALYISVDDGAGMTTLSELDLQTGAIKPGGLAASGHDISSVVYDARKARATGVRYIDDLPRTVFFDSAEQRMQSMLDKALPDATPVVESESDDGQQVIVRAVYTDHPDQYFVFDRAARRLDMIAPTYPAIDGSVYAKKQKFDYQASDGLTVPGYLTAPTGAAMTSMPLIVLPHGGPETRDDQSFDWWSFFYAARGYLVYQPNFRGSDGYGRAFREAGFGEWGRKMQSDISEGVRKLIADGVVDPKRVCIVGASYGGYAALAGATLTPDLYACAVSYSGVSDLPLMLATEREYAPAERFWEKRMGATRFKNTDELIAVSPARQADKARAPILLMHGKDDTIVPLFQSSRMRDALKAAGKAHVYVELKGEDHWLSRSTSRTEMLERSIAFIDEHIGAK